MDKNETYRNKDTTDPDAVYIQDPMKEIADLAKRFDRLQLTNTIALFIAAAVLLFVGIFGIIRSIKTAVEPEPTSHVVFMEEPTPTPVPAEIKTPEPSATVAPTPTPTPVPTDTPSWLPQPDVFLKPTPTPGTSYGPSTVIVVPDGNGGTVALTPEPTPVPTMSQDPYVAELLRLTNEERKKAGLKELTYMADQQNAAQIRAREAYILFSHTRPNDDNYDTVLTRNWNYAGENLLLIDLPIATPERMMQAWMDSPGHRENILNPKYSEVAIGVAYFNNTVYVSQLFVGY